MQSNTARIEKYREEVRKRLSSDREQFKKEIQAETDRNKLRTLYSNLRNFVVNPVFIPESSQSYTKEKARARCLECIEHIENFNLEKSSKIFEESETLQELIEEISTESVKKENSETKKNMAGTSTKKATVKCPDAEKFSSVGAFSKAFKCYAKLNDIDVENGQNGRFHYLLALSTHPEWGDISQSVEETLAKDSTESAKSLHDKISAIRSRR